MARTRVINEILTLSEENPLFVMWKSETISIEILNKYKQGSSELTFKIIN
ncbi:hypothetical protein T190607A02C_90158 [Tenacibaculum sp. 190524A02b]